MRRTWARSPDWLLLRGIAFVAGIGDGVAIGLALGMLEGIGVAIFLCILFGAFLAPNSGPVSGPPSGTAPVKPSRPPATVARRRYSSRPMDAKDITTTSFGLLIAYFVPGLICFYAGGFWIHQVHHLFMTFSTTSADFGLFLLVVMAGLAIGMVLTPIKSLIYEQALGRNHKLRDDALQRLADPAVSTNLRIVIDEQYRYHQCWGNLSLALIPLTIGWFHIEWRAMSDAGHVIAVVIAVIGEGATVWAAIESYRRYIMRATAVLS